MDSPCPKKSNTCDRRALNNPRLDIITYVKKHKKDTAALTAVICSEEKPKGVSALTKSPDVPQSIPAIMIYINAFLFILRLLEGNRFGVMSRPTAKLHSVYPLHIAIRYLKIEHLEIFLNS